MTLTEFWDSTPREVVEVINAASWRSSEQYRDTIRGAWLTANYTRAKDLPNLQSILGDTEARRPQMSPEAELAVWDMWASRVNASIGAPPPSECSPSA